MTASGRIIRDAWVFGLLDESETCEGWSIGALEDLWREVNQEWGKYGFLVNNLPDDLRERFVRIQNQALHKARAAGWDPELNDNDQAVALASRMCFSMIIGPGQYWRTDASNRWQAERLFRNPANGFSGGFDLFFDAPPRPVIS